MGKTEEEHEIDYERAKEIAEEAVFDWYAIEPGWHDSLPGEAVEALQEQIAQAILRAQRRRR